MQAQSLTTAATTTATDAISLSRSFDSLSMDAEFINFLLDGPVEQQPTAAAIKGQDTITQDPYAQPAAVDQFAFSDSVTEQNVNASRTSPIAAGMPLPPSPPSDGLALSSPSLDDPFAGLTDIFPLLNDLVEPALREEEEIDSGNLPNTTTASSSSTTTTTAPAAASLVKVKEEPKEPKRKSTKEKKASRAAKKQKLEPQPSEFIESLRGLNSAQLEHYAETQPLTEAQQTELKEWIRKIKNRESASLSRQNRKNHQQELEIQIEGLDSSNSRLREQITELQIENRVLKKELDEFKTLIERSNLGQAFALYNNTKKAAAPAPAPAPTSADAPAATAAETVKPVSTTSSAPVATATPAAPPAAAGGIQLSDVILKAMAGGQPNKEGMALVLYLLMALHSYGQYWNKVTAQHQLALSQPQPQPDEVPVQA